MGHITLAHQPLRKKIWKYLVFLVLLVCMPTMGVFALTDTERRAILEKELAELEAQIKIQEQELARQKMETGSISRDVSILTNEIKAKRLEIDRKNGLIRGLSSDIREKNKTINDLAEELNREKASLARILRNMYEIESYTMPEFLLANVSVSKFFVERDEFSQLQEAFANSFRNIEENKIRTAEEKKSLEEKQAEENNIRYQLEQEKKTVERKESEKKNLLAQSKTKEKTYEQIIAERKARAAEIRAALIKFQGSGVQSRSISFGEAYDYAKFASEKTGVRPALILAIMQQETGFGNNVGGCHLKDGSTGAGVYIKTGNPSQRNMVPGNFDNFVKITSSLGLDWKTTPISCALVRSDGSIFGHGGAMGYTQFIPNTWMGVEARVRQYLGASIANPWNPQHAVTATAIFLKDKGASAQTYNAEYNAACRYYGACSTYASSVMSKAASIQQDIDFLEGR